MTKPPVDRRVAALRRFAISITGFSIVGHLFLGFEQSWLQWLVALGAAYALELGLETLRAFSLGGPAAYRGGWQTLVNFLLPAHIAASSIALLIYPGGRLFPFVFASSIAICAKYLFRAPVNGRYRHVFNPSNLAIAVTLTLFTWVGPAPPYHFIEFTSGLLDWIIPLVLLASGLLLNIGLTGKWPLIAAWVGGFVVQAVLRDVFVGDALVTILAMMAGPAFLLYTNYMITDPGTTPVRARNQVAFGATTALIYGLLASSGVVFGLFYALVITCALRGVGLYLLHVLALRARRRVPGMAETPPGESAGSGAPRLVREGV